jgi:hypothetical protein
MTSAELAAINAALRLGDPAAPPPGTVLTWEDLPVVWVVEKIHFRRHYICVHIVRLKDMPRDVGRVSCCYDVPMDVVPTIVQVPGNAPPFDEWPRFR